VNNDRAPKKTAGATDCDRRYIKWRQKSIQRSSTS